MLVEDGNLRELQDVSKRYPLKRARTDTGLNILALAPAREIGEFLLEQGVETDDESGLLLTCCYDDIAKWLTCRSVDILPAIQQLETCLERPLSPTTRRQSLQRLQQLSQWKQETNRKLVSILIEDCGIIKDLSLLIVGWL